MASNNPPTYTGKGPSSRAWALIRKETRQMLRDKSTLTLGIILPILLLLLFGFGLSLDVKLVPVAVVRDSSSPVTRDLYTSLKLSAYFDPTMVNSWKEAEHMLRVGSTDAIVRRDMKESSDGREHVQIIVNGRDSNTARIMQRYLEGASSRWASLRQSNLSFLSGGAEVETVGRATAETRIWYNSEQESKYFLIPGVTVLIMTLIGTLLTALVIAREWERGTYEALAATPVKRWEIVAGKTVPYFVLGMIGLCMCLTAATWIFGVPMRGSLLLIIAGSAIYMLVALGMGLLISAAVKNQFLASQIVLILSFMPTLMLSGFIFDLKSAPIGAYYLAHVFPATWYVDLMQTLFLVGNVPGQVIRDFLIMACFAVVLLSLAGASIRKSLE
ncbi:ABC-2 [uncultured delta proteobacterium]|uniref:ABC-2 n=1 Tax=uncultured delta proteobacterium TaxID=34034 RepID=A0A212JP10_9DELT|nr:ABC-2 [uncultured delta proteobacterium]